MQIHAIDQRYLQLYREYASAIRALEIATEGRSRTRSALKAERTGPPKPRRPVGSPSNFRIPQAPTKSVQPVPPPPAKRVYLGKILGWAKIVYTSPIMESAPEPSAYTDANRMYDNISLQMYQKARNRYEKAKEAFFDYVRRQNVKEHRGRAEQGMSHMTNLQWLGADDASAKAWADVQDEIEKACQNAWAIYRNSPTPKSDEAKLLLIENLADAQSVGIGERPIASTMQSELVRLHDSGKLPMLLK
jgi:hypothetical protein